MSTPAPVLKIGTTLSSKKMIGEALVEMGALTKKEIDEAVQRGVQKKIRVGELLVQEGTITPRQLAEALALQYGIDFVDLTGWSPSPAAVSKLPEKIARANLILPVEMLDGTLIVAGYDPIQFVKLDNIKKNLNCAIVLKVCTKQQIEEGLDRAYSSGTSVEGIVEHLYKKQMQKKPATPSNVVNLSSANSSAATIEALVNRIIDRGVDDGASDIHIDPAEDKVRVRLRIDGNLLELHTYPVDLHASIVSRLKILAHLDISEKRNPQDGRFQHFSNGIPTVDIRISSLPTIRGEKLVLRILDKNKLRGTLGEIGMSREISEEVQALLQRPYGMIFITGPTGSGKTTTLYSMLNQINQLDTNIITVEDPVEYKFDIINQVQVNEKAGLGFSSILRNILRQDPDVLMIGEVRDRETADIAIRSALTGHLVVSTLHTNDAVSTPNRLIDMGIEPYLLSSALSGVLAQRLVRVLCTHCRIKVTLTEQEVRLLGTTTLAPGASVYGPVGCVKCSGSGYKHRIALFELMVFDSEIQKMVVERKAEAEILSYLMTKGFTSMRQDGICKVAAGITSVEEVLRATI